MENKTPEMKLATIDKQRIKSMVVDLMLQTQALTKKDIGTWRNAWQMALNIENPQRARLYDVYTDVDCDLHLTGAISQRKGMVMQKSFKMVDKNGKENKEVTALFEDEWFKQFISLSLDSIYWGHSLIQFGDLVKVNNKPRFENCILIPRKHVIPEYGVIVREVGDEPKKGISYLEGKLTKWCLPVGSPHNLGLLLKLSPQALAKKNMLAFWDQFGELFGMPIRIAKTTSRDDKERSKIESMLEQMGAATWGLFQEGTEIEIKETQRGDAFKVYDQRVERANSEMSKGILGETMTLDNGSSKSQSETHLNVFQNIVDQDADMVKDIVHNRLVPFMVMHGFPVEGYGFKWDENIDYTPEQQMKIEEMILNQYEVDPAYFQDKYNIPVTGIKKNTTASFFD
jgi:hypothetical protein